MNRICGRLERLPFASRSFDVIVSGLALPDVDRLQPVVSEWSRVLVPGGIVVSSMLHPRGESLGWTRTFDTPCGLQALPAHWHSIEACRTAFEAHDLWIDAVLEPSLTREPLGAPPPAPCRTHPSHHTHPSHQTHPPYEAANGPVVLVVRARRLE
jgi:SAM-dependent methyltransferase